MSTFDPIVIVRLGLPGKPDPAMFPEAARRLGVIRLERRAEAAS